MKKNTTTRKTPQKTMLVVRIDPTLKKRFMANTKRQGKNMTEVILAAVRELAA